MNLAGRKAAFISLAFALAACSQSFVAAPSFADWPTFQHDMARSGATTETPPADPQLAWLHRSPSRPRPAWDEPALWDGWSKVHDLTNRQVFDKAFQVAVVGDAVYFGSSVDDKVYCLDAETGQERWTFFTEGPVRLAPTVVGQRLYVGSDDGYVYCLEAATGKLHWKHRPGPSPRRVAGNERVISPWAVRTSVIVVGDRAFCGAGVIPSETVYVCALDAQTGEEIWKSPMNDLPAQGYMLASQTRLYVVAGRDRPLVFEAATGKRLHQVAGGAGGTYALLTGDTLMYGPGKTGQVNMIGAEKQDVLASFGGSHMIVAKPLSFLHSGKELSALDREEYVRLYAVRTSTVKRKNELSGKLKKANEAIAAQLKSDIASADEEIKQLTQQIKECVKWTSPSDCSLSLVLAGNTLLAGGVGKVVAVDATSGTELWQRAVPGKAYGLAVASGRLLVSTDEGTIHCFAELPRVASARKPGNDGHIDQQPLPAQPYFGPFAASQPPPAEILGPIAEFISPGTIRVAWDSQEPCTSVLEFGTDMENARRWADERPKQQHELTVDQVQRDVIYQLRVSGKTSDGRQIATEPYRFDAHFDYLPMEIPDRPSPYPEDELTSLYEATARKMLQAAGVLRGYALVIGTKNGRLAYHLARNSELKIVVVESDPAHVQRAREALDQAGVHGTQVSVHEGDPADLPYGPFLANLIVSESMLLDGKLPPSLSSIYRCLRPAGGTIVLGGWNATEGQNQFQAWRDSMSLDSGWNSLDIEGDEFWTHRRGKLAGTGEWTHQYASPDNSGCSQDDRVRGELTVQWWGRPGRPMPDRGNRNPPPVSANGRLYVQGNRTLFGLDAYNGTILWSKQIPTMRRANMPRDGSNMVATDEHLWLALGESCLAFDGQTGQRVLGHPVPESLREGQDHNWGYLSRVGELLVGSGVRPGSQYMGDKGEWYEKAIVEHTARVTSDYLFAMHHYTGSSQWHYKNGIVINSTITIADGVVYFIESRSEAAKTSSTGRMLEEVLQDQVLVALDLQSGELIWEKPYDFSKCQQVTYLTYGNGTLLVSGTDEDRHFHTYAFDATTGDELWQHDTPDKKGHHTGQLAHPTIVGDRVYFNKHTYVLRTGEVLSVHDFNWHGCGIMSASSHSIFSRYEYHGMFDLETQKRTELLGIRSGCWLSLIPSGGLLLAPETSAGCSCGHSLQTSIAYVPKSALEGVDDADEQ